MTLGIFALIAALVVFLIAAWLGPNPPYHPRLLAVGLTLLTLSFILGGMHKP